MGKNKILSKEEINDIKNLRNKVIKFKEIYYNDIPYYVDEFNNICDSNIKLVGFVKCKPLKQENYVFFTLRPKSNIKL